MPTTVSANGDTDTIYLQQSGSNVQYKINSGSWTSISAWPCTMTNTSSTNVLKILFTTNITLNTDTTRYFICGSKLLQFGSSTLNSDGTVTTVTVDGISGFLGLVRNGSASNGYNDVSIYNIFVTAVNSATLAGDAGWIGQIYFARGATNNLIVNCSSDGAIPAHAGGIVGQFSANNGGNLTIRACYTTGSIGSSAGGIIAESCSGSTNSVITMERCWSSGTIDTSAGGMTGNSCGINGGSVSCTDCYSTAPSIAGNGGGIFGITNGYGTNGSATATRCYSTGSIAGSAGGIFGGNAALSSGSTSATNCFSTGDIASGGGGIYGTNYSGTGASASRCYTTGSTTSGTSGGIWAGSGSDSVLGSNNYGEGNHGSSGWSDSRARTYLTGAPSTTSYGTSWSQPNGTNTAYILSASGYSPYSTTLTNSITGSVAAGNSTSAPIVSGYSYSLFQINGSTPATFDYISIGPSTGAITVLSSTPAGVYTIIVYSTKNPYSITSYSLTVTDAPLPSTTTTASCCVEGTAVQGLPFEWINDYRIGNRLIYEHSQNSNLKFNGYSEYVKYKMAQASRKT